jgi:hypothetical protein
VFWWTISLRRNGDLVVGLWVLPWASLNFWGRVVLRHSRVIARVCRGLAGVLVGVSLSGCAVGTLSVRGPSSNVSDHLHQSFLDQAAMISKSAWDEVRSSGSRFGAWATILMEGRAKPDPTALAASSEATSPAASYLALKAESGATPQQQLTAVVADVDDKTSQVDAFIRFADELAADYRRRETGSAELSASHVAEQNRLMIDSDRHVLEHAVAELKSQKATYETVERELKAARPDLDTASLANALAALEQRISHLTLLAQSMSEQPVG